VCNASDASLSGFQVSPGEEATKCDLCPAGKFQDTAAQTDCRSCIPGSFSNLEGSASCLDCSGNSFSAAAATECALCLKDFFFSLSGECEKCPEGVDCLSDGGATQTLMTLESDYWRISSVASEIYLCERHACKGGSLVPGEFADGLADRQRRRLSDDSAEWSDGYCNKGHTGPLCSTCGTVKGTKYYLSNKGCKPCSDTFGLNAFMAFVTVSSVMIFLVILLLALAYWLATLFHWSPSEKSKKKMMKLTDEFEKNCDNVKVRRTIAKSMSYLVSFVSLFEHDLDNHLRKCSLVTPTIFFELNHR
jgi:hypothetical protein